MSATLFAALVMTLSAFMTLSAAGCTAQTPSTDPTTDASQARQQLDGLAVAAPRSMSGYSRDRFQHWSAQGNGCDTRDTVLRRDGTGVTTGSGCRVTSGTWLSPYDNKQVADPADVDIDHMVPLANAWRSGANAWSDDRRTAFANDLDRPQLIAVTAASNRAKGDQDPSQWKPPNRGFWCEYAKRWTAVKAHWSLTVTEAEKAALIDMLAKCQPQRSAVPT